MRALKTLSVVIPCHNEEEVIPVTHKRLTAILTQLCKDKKCAHYEIVYVDNGSTDKTLETLRELFEKDEHIRIIALRRNFGYQGSISAGLAHARGDAVVTIDADLQDPPEKIEEMIGHFEQDYDLVLGVRQNRNSDSFLKRFFSENYYRLLKILGVEVVFNHSDFRLMAKSLVDEFNQLSERNRLIRAMILKLDSRYATVSYDRQTRKLGRSKFNLHSLFSLSLDGITSFSYVPLRIASILGFFLCLGALIAIGWVIKMKLTTNAIPGWASTLLPILGFSGFQMLLLGLIGEYIGRLYIEVKRRPLFVVRKEYSRK